MNRKTLEVELETIRELVQSLTQQEIVLLANIAALSPEVVKPKEWWVRIVNNPTMPHKAYDSPSAHSIHVREVIEPEFEFEFGDKVTMRRDDWRDGSASSNGTYVAYAGGYHWVKRANDRYPGDYNTCELVEE